MHVEIPRTPQAPARARRAVERLGESIDPALKPDVVLLVSELVTNSVKYSSDGHLRLHIDSRGPRRLRVEVVDEGDGFVPRPRTRPVTDVGGWGLHLVETLADRWGVQDDAARVWFEIDR